MQDMDLTHVWYRLSGFWSYLDFTLLEQLLDKFDDKELKTHIRTYKEELKNFRCHTRLCDFAKCFAKANARNARKHYSIELLEDTVRLTLGLSWEDCQLLENLMRLKQFLTQHFFLPSFSMVLRSINPHDDITYMEVKLATPTKICRALQHTMKVIDTQEFLGNHDIMRLCFLSKYGFS